MEICVLKKVAEHLSGNNYLLHSCVDNRAFITSAVFLELCLAATLFFSLNSADSYRSALLTRFNFREGGKRSVSWCSTNHASQLSCVWGEITRSGQLQKWDCSHPARTIFWASYLPCQTGDSENKKLPIKTVTEWQKFVTPTLLQLYFQCLVLPGFNWYEAKAKCFFSYSFCLWQNAKMRVNLCSKNILRCGLLGLYFLANCAFIMARLRRRNEPRKKEC